MNLTKHYVTFLSPGTFFAETTSKEIDSWDPELALSMSKEVVERYGATPYGFYFTTRERGDEVFDGKETARSGTYFIGGTVETLEEVERRADPTEKILLSNMKGNGWNKIFRTKSPWSWRQPFLDGDVLLEEP